MPPIFCVLFLRPPSDWSERLTVSRTNTNQKRDEAMRNESAVQFETNKGAFMTMSRRQIHRGAWANGILDQVDDGAVVLDVALAVTGKILDGSIQERAVQSTGLGGTSRPQARLGRKSAIAKNRSILVSLFPPRSLLMESEYSVSSTMALSGLVRRTSDRPARYMCIARWMPSGFRARTAAR